MLPCYDINPANSEELPCALGNQTGLNNKKVVPSLCQSKPAIFQEGPPFRNARETKLAATVTAQNCKSIPLPAVQAELTLKQNICFGPSCMYIYQCHIMMYTCHHPLKKSSYKNNSISKNWDFRNDQRCISLDELELFLSSRETLDVFPSPLISLVHVMIDRFTCKKCGGLPRCKLWVYQGQTTSSIGIIPLASYHWLGGFLRMICSEMVSDHWIQLG